MKNKWFKLIVFFLIPLILLVGCQRRPDRHVLKVAATSIPHAEILEAIKPELKERGIHLEILIVEDYNTANRALHEKEVDANFFQHEPFLNIQMEDFGYDLEKFASIHVEPMGLYSKKVKNLKELKPEAIIAVPSDPTNQARALCLLQKYRLLKLKKCDMRTTVLDIIENPSRLNIIEVDSPLLVRALDDVTAAAITANFALQAGFSPENDALIKEGPDSIFTNIIVIRKGEGNRPELRILKEVVTSNKVKLFIQDHYKEAINPAF